MRIIHAQNARADRKWTAGVNQFTDLNKEEMKSMKGINKDMLHSRRAKVCMHA